MTDDNVIDIRSRRRGDVSMRCPHGRTYRRCVDCARAAETAELEAHIDTMREALDLARSIERLVETDPVHERRVNAAKDECVRRAAGLRARATMLGLGHVGSPDDDKEKR